MQEKVLRVSRPYFFPLRLKLIRASHSVVQITHRLLRFQNKVSQARGITKAPESVQILRPRPHRPNRNRAAQTPAAQAKVCRRTDSCRRAASNCSTRRAVSQTRESVGTLWSSLPLGYDVVSGLKTNQPNSGDTSCRSLVRKNQKQ